MLGPIYYKVAMLLVPHLPSFNRQPHYVGTLTTGKQNQSLSSQIQRRACGVEPGSSGAAPHLATDCPSLLHPASTLFDLAFLWCLSFQAVTS